MGCCGSQDGRSLTAKEWLVLIVIGSVHFTGAICISIQAPFYPEEAETKNVTASQYGFVFGIYDAVAVVASPIVGNYIHDIGAKQVLNVGVFTTGISAVLFGTLAYAPGPKTFLSLSLLIRTVESLGATAAVTSAFAITAAVFPDNLATTFATLEICYGAGFILGPLIGGFLHSLGGFFLPFVALGSLILLDGLLIFFVLPAFPSKSVIKKGNFWGLMKIPGVVVCALCITGVTMCDGFYNAVLEPHIRSFGLPMPYVGVVFITSGFMYALFAPAVGRLCDTCVNPRFFLLFGSLLIVGSIMLTGPAPFIPLGPSLPLVLGGLALLGLAMASILVSAFTDAIQTALASGFSDDLQTYALVSGMWSSAFSLGDFIGPSVGGLLYDTLGFRWASMYIVAVQVLIFTTTAVFLTRRRQPKDSLELQITNEILGDSESAPLKMALAGYGSHSSISGDESLHRDQKF